MTTADFYRVLATTQGYKWEVDHEGCIVGKTRVKGTYMQVCPVTAVYRKLTKRYIYQYEYVRASKILGLRKREIERIICAADDDDKHSRRVRVKLLNTLMLKD